MISNLLTALQVSKSVSSLLELCLLVLPVHMLPRLRTLSSPSWNMLVRGGTFLPVCKLALSGLLLPITMSLVAAVAAMYSHSLDYSMILQLSGPPRINRYGNCNKVLSSIHTLCTWGPWLYPSVKDGCVRYKPH